MASFPIGDVAWKHRNGLSTGIAHGRPTIGTVGETRDSSDTALRSGSHRPTMDTVGKDS